MRGCGIPSGVESASEYRFECRELRLRSRRCIDPRHMETQMVMSTDTHDNLFRATRNFGGLNRFDSLSATFRKGPLTLGATIEQ